MATTTTQSRWRSGRWALMGGVLLVSMGVLAFTAIGLFNGAASTDHTTTAGHLTLDLNDPAHGTAMSIASTALAPTDVIERVVDLDVSGNVSVTALKLTTTASVSSVLDTDAVHGLQLKIEVCDQAWDPDDNGHPYECGSGGGGTTQTVLASRAVIGANLALNNLDLAGMNHLKITMTFAGGAADDDLTFAGDPSSTIHFVFSGTQRASQYK